MGRALMGSCSEECCAGRMILLWAGKEPLSCRYIDMGIPKPERSRSIAADFGERRSSSQPQLATVQGDLMVLVLLPTCRKTKQVLSRYWDVGIWDPQDPEVTRLHC